MSGKGKFTKGRPARPAGKIKGRGALGLAKKGMGTLPKNDARLIIKKNRSKVKDARQKLEQLAREKFRDTRLGVNTSGASVTTSIGGTIIKKTDRNGKISLTTSRTAVARGDINVAVRKELGLMPGATQRLPPVRRVAPAAAPMSLRTMVHRPYSRTTTAAMDLEPGYKIPVFQRIIRNDLSSRRQPVAAAYPSADLLRWVRPSAPTSTALRRAAPLSSSASTDPMLIDEEDHHHHHHRSWAYTTGDPSAMSMRSIRATEYVDLDAPIPEPDYLMEIPTRPVVRRAPSKGVHSRLDTPAPAQQVMARTKVVVPTGHRIVVSNLQPTVTEDDIRELFEDIGTLLVARLVRTGTAEVIYKNLKDAQRAVETYHNRQLDGYPMKCLLVNNSTPAKVISSPAPAKKAATTDSSQKLVPDISTIHKVLFHKS